MPSKHSIKVYAPETYFHVFNRGVEKRTIFLDDQDYHVFLKYLRRHLSRETSYDEFKRPYRNLSNDVELLAYCLMPNHFHLLLYQKSSTGIEPLMRSVLTAYTMYFNKRYRRVGTLFQGPYKAAPIISDEQLMHVSRYIHQNPKAQFKEYKFSSLKAYMDKATEDWLNPLPVLNIVDNYASFMGTAAESKKLVGSAAID